MRSFTYPEFCAALTRVNRPVRSARVAVRKSVARTPRKG
jgi:hypothetical protein